MLDITSRLAQYIIAELNILRAFVAGEGAHATFILKSGFVLSEEMKTVVAQMETVKVSIEKSLDASGVSRGIGGTNLLETLKVVMDVDHDIGREIIEFVDEESPAKFVARYDALKGTDAHEKLEARFRTELRLFRAKVSVEKITLDEAIEAYGLMDGIMQYIEEQAKAKHSMAATARPVQNRIRSVLNVKPAVSNYAAKKAAKRLADAQRRAGMQSGKGDSKPAMRK